MRIILSGLTAAGKTTHGKLLARHLGLPYYSSSQLIAELVGVSGPWTPDMDVARADDDIDLEADRRICQAFDSAERGVFDAWALAWLSDGKAIRVWLESDLPSRVRKAAVTELRRGSTPRLQDLESLVTAKDEFSRAQFQRLYSFDLFTDQDVFDVTVNNSGFIPEASILCSDAGIVSFAGVLHGLITDWARISFGHQEL
jgi:cytidylate kinase